jgi:hypothetical protein
VSTIPKAFVEFSSCSESIVGRIEKRIIIAGVMMREMMNVRVFTFSRNSHLAIVKIFMN